MNLQYDYIIVGAGSAGCVLANRLSADPNTSVLLIEAGGYDNLMWIHIPVGYLYCIGNPRTDWLYHTAEEPGLNGRKLLYPRGKVLGGCSSINGMIYMRGQRGDYDGWAAAGNPGWAWDDVLPLFIQSESHHGRDLERSNSAAHGYGGEWRVERQRLSWKILDAFREAAADCNIPSIEDFNHGNNHGCGYFEVNQKRGVRWTTAKAFLHPISRGSKARPNLTVMTQTHVTALDFEGRRCRGVTVRTGDTIQNLEARGETILCAGAIGSPQLLELAGIGQPDLLDGLGITTRHPLRGVGENLQDHLQLRLAFTVQNIRTLNTLANSLAGKAWMALQYALLQRGPLSMAPSQLGAFAHSSPNIDRPDLEYHVQPLSLDRFGEPLHPYPAFTASVCHLRPSSRGSVHVQSADASNAPRIAPNYLSTEEDLAVAAQAIRLTRRIVAQPALAPFAPQEFRPGPKYDTEADLRRAAGDIGTTIFHPVGTCKMGPASDPSAVVDAQLRVHGIDRLRVVDASIMPTITSGNTNSPTIMIAEKAAKMILAR